MANLEVENLCKGWDFPVIDQLNLQVEEGEFFVIVGPSGIGKTTLLRLVAGLEHPDQGTIRVGPRVVTRLPPYQRRVAMTFESYALYPHLTVFENIASPLRARRLKRDVVQKRVTEVAELLRIESLLKRRPGEISGGQKQRTALGRTLVAEPEVFLLDEPLSHLDAKIRHELRRQFHELEALRAVATVYVTHDYAEALSLGNRIGVMGHGTMVQIGDAREIFRRPANVFVARHLGQPTVNTVPCRLNQVSGVLYSESESAGLRYPIASEHLAALTRRDKDSVTVGIRPQHLQVLHPDEAADEPTTDATVQVFEALGSMGVLIADLGGLNMTALTSPDRHFDRDQPIRLRLKSQDFLYFDADNGRNLLL